MRDRSSRATAARGRLVFEDVTFTLRRGRAGAEGGELPPPNRARTWPSSARRAPARPASSTSSPVLSTRRRAGPRRRRRRARHSPGGPARAASAWRCRRRCSQRHGGATTSLRPARRHGRRVVAAAKAAQAHDFILGPARGLRHPRGPAGANLSGGQKSASRSPAPSWCGPRCSSSTTAPARSTWRPRPLISDALDGVLHGCTRIVIASA